MARRATFDTEPLSLAAFDADRTPDADDDKRPDPSFGAILRMPGHGPEAICAAAIVPTLKLYRAMCERKALAPAGLPYRAPFSTPSRQDGFVHDAIGRAGNISDAASGGDHPACQAIGRAGRFGEKSMRVIW